MTVLDWAIVAFTLALGAVGLPAGPDRRRADPGRLRRWAPSPAAGSGRWCSPRAPSRPTRRSARRSGRCWPGALVAVAVESFALGLRAKVIRRPVLHLADGAGGAALIASVALGLAWVFGAVALHAPGDRAAARRRPGVGDPAQPQRGAAAVGPGPQRARPGRPGALDDRPGGAGRARPTRRSPPIPRCCAPATRWCGCSAPPAGSGSRARAGRWRPAWSSPTPTSSPAPTTPRSPPRTGSSSTRRRSTTTRRTTWRCCGSAPTCRPCRSPTQRESGADAAVLGYPENGPYAVAPARLGETRTTISEDSYGNGPVERTIVALRRLGPQRQLRRAAGRRRRAGSSAPSSPPPRPAPPGGFAIPAEVVREALAPTPRHRSRPAPCTALSCRKARSLTFSKLGCRGTGHLDSGPGRRSPARSARTSTPRSS